MRIELQSPFNEKYRKGYLVTNTEPRRNVVLFNGNKDRTTISYARYLMSVDLDMELPKNWVVDHVDNNKLNDTIENLQLLTSVENIKKSAKPKTYKVFICPMCRASFQLEARQSHRKNPCCSRKCGYNKMKAGRLVG